MIFEKDWLMRQIYELVQLASQLVFHRSSVIYEVQDPSSLTEADKLYRRMLALTAAGAYGAAEDLLFESYDPQDDAYLRLALDFYRRLNDLSDGELEAGDFSREEIEDGLSELLARSGVDLADV